ncbi:F-box/FBD/LRR-repeat protein At1g13570-like [Aegilops tauschii subsp. strangulata]|uniref:F-box/FBD/LRR-repeat protein At1g13570-like n=1 Tax=Aegilops tauschii subsp. strangulata TaxID=200361 RepID=UPI001E1CA967|nr:F-box/FBD/LRR-repeat protein At1g13570-like [Aegilops tauschii subsp. strangulata]
MARQQGPAARRRGGVLWPLRSCLAAGRSRRAASPSPVLPHTPTATPRQFNLDSEAMSTCKMATVEATSVPDRLSSLPPEIKGNILSRLNIVEAVRTCTLSSTWRDAWTDMPKISLRDGKFTRTKFVTLVDMVLSLHKGTIEQFDISGSESYHDEFARWMLMLSSRSPRSIIIELKSRPRYRIPSCIFSISHLKSLHLENCTISLPRVFQGFKSLTDLSLKFFSSTNMDIQNLISFCPVLTNLILNYFEGINRLNIQAPELEYLNVVGDFEDIDLDAPNLKAAILFHYHKSKAYQSIPIAHDKESHVKKSLGSLSEIKTLGISSSFMKYLSKACILTKLPIMFTRLEDIYLTICFWDQRQVLTVCSLFQNAPNLKKLLMWSYPGSTCDQDQASIQELTLQMQMNHLITVSVNDFRGVDHEVHFVAKLLSWAPALEEVRIEWKGEMDRSMVITKLLALPRVSPRAKIIVT